MPNAVTSAREPLRMSEQTGLRGPSRNELEPKYLMATQVAELLQVNEKTIYRWATQDATMPVLRIGGVVRFPRERVLRWLRNHEQGFGRARRLAGPAAPGETVAPRQPA